MAGRPYVKQEYEPSVALDSLTPHPANPNQGDTGLIGQLIDANGFAGAVMAQRSTGIIIDGEHRWRAARQKGLTALPVLWLDVDDDARDRLLASWNESTRRGRNDEAALLDLLTGLTGTPGGLAGTGFNGDDVDDLLTRLNKPLTLPGGAGSLPGDDEDQDDDEEDEDDTESPQHGPAGQLVEMTLVMSSTRREVMSSLMDQVRDELDIPAARPEELLMRALRVLCAVLAEDHGLADDLARAKEE